MNDNKRFFQASGLKQWLLETSQTALNNGSLQSLSTELVTLSSTLPGTIPFEVRKLSSLRTKPSHKFAKNTGKNPFLPYEQALYICHLQAGHVILLNKFNVVDHHLLVVTPEFEAQETLLGEKEFHAMLQVMGSFPMLAFYNSGMEAGASQPHRHFQAFPQPAALPVDAVLNRISQNPERLLPLPFPNLTVDIAGKTAEQVYKLYLSMISQFNPGKPAGQLPAPYNLLMTDNWMMIIPRTHDRYQGISINALGFAGLILVKNDEQLEVVQSLGGNRLLAEVCA